MKKIVALLMLVVVALAAPLGAMADDVRTPADCADEAAPGWVFEAGAADGRGAFCVSDGDASNGNELYIGGDATAPCGHVEVLGNVLTEEDDETPEGFCH